jgi:hypothetical protein
MQNEFVPYQPSLDMKELGFDKPCLTSYNENGKIFKVWENEIVIGITKCSAPLYQQAFRWFREKYGLFAEIKPYLIIGTEWRYTITNRNNSSGLPYEEEFETYEKAEIACLKKLIEIVKNQTKN